MQVGLDRRWKLPDSLLCLESKIEPSVANALNFIRGGGGTAYIFLIGGKVGRGLGHPKYVVDEGNTWSGTSHNIERNRTNVYWKGGTPHILGTPSRKPSESI